ncbi:MAG: hypothetical protein M3O46_13415 [Myxococcota bacterium]|nr:hypothetical protein [Myxococcota bacterium]
MVHGKSLGSSAPPPGYRRVPSGYAHPSCIHEVPNGSTIDGDDVLDSSGAIVTHLEKCAYPSVMTAGHAVVKDLGAPVPEPPVPGANGNLEEAYQHLPAGSSTWNDVQAVVTVPTWSGRHGETLFYWNGLQNTSTRDFVQPVLQWGPANGPGGGDSWGIASWAWQGCLPFEICGAPTFTSLVGVDPGDQILLHVYLNTVRLNVQRCPCVRFVCRCHSTDDYQWAIVASDLTKNRMAVMFWWTHMPVGWGAFPLAFTAVLEGALDGPNPQVQGLVTCPSASVTFSQLSLSADQNVWPPTTRVPQTNNPFTAVTADPTISCFFGVFFDSSSTTLL